MVRRSIKEHKSVAAQMDRYDPLLEDAVYAFRASEILGLIGEITGLGIWSQIPNFMQTA